MFDKQKYLNWYNNPLVRENLVHFLNYREGALLGPKLSVRNMRIRKSNHLIENMKRFDVMKDPINWYYSLAVLPKMPIFSFNWEERKKQSRLFKQTFETFMVGYDLALDFDSKHTPFSRTYRDMKKAHKWLSLQNCAHSVRFSGSGFHILIYSNHIWQSPFIFNKKHSMKLCEMIALKIKGRLDLDSLDVSLYDERRIWKVPYSMDIKTGNICRPLNKFEINNFDIEMVQPEYCIKNSREVFFNRPTFKGTNRKIHQFIFDMFSSRCRTARQIWAFIGQQSIQHEVDIQRGR